MSDLEAVKPPRLVVALVLFVVAFAFVPDLFRPPPHPLRGKKAPPLDALRETAGKTVVVGFWTSWSDLGEKQIGILDGLAKHHPDVAFVGLDTVDAPDALDRWRAAHSVAIPIAFDDDSAARAFEVNNVPMTFVIARDGTIVDVAMGMTEAADIEAMIRRAR